MKKTSIGGQAVMEGVMMKSMDNMALAVRNTKGEIVMVEEKISPWMKKNKVLSMPFIRGAVNLAESLTLSMKNLSDSATLAGVEEEPTKFEKWLAQKTGKSVMDVMMPVAMFFAVLLSIGMYIVLPALCAKGFQLFIENGALVNLLEGLVRMLILVGYLAAISLMNDVKRLLAYHGAEHKTIACYEAGLELTPENARKMTRLHPRCGTSFLFLVMLISILIFLCFGAIESLWLRVGIRLLMVPIVAAVSYEALKALAKGKGKCIAFIRAPGLWMQKFTTKEPDDDMLEVAIAAFKRVLEMDEEDRLARLAEKEAKEEALKQAQAAAEASEETDAENAEELPEQISEETSEQIPEENAQEVSETVEQA